MNEIAAAHKLAIEAIQKQIQKIAFDANTADLFGATHPHAVHASRQRAALQRAITILKQEALMTTGMMWFDNSKVSLAVKVERAARYYQKKFGEFPTLCFVRWDECLPSDPKSLLLEKTTVQIRTFQSILPSHFWLGIGDEA
jgi:hypothetical protein